MIDDLGAASSGRCLARVRGGAIVLAEGSRSRASAEAALACCDSLDDPESSPLLAASAALRRINTAPACAGSRVGILYAEHPRRASLAHIGDVRLWRCRGRLTEQVSDSTAALSDAAGLAGARPQMLRLDLPPGTRVVAGTRGIAALSVLDIYTLLSSARGAQATAEALVALAAEAGQDIAVGVAYATRRTTR